MTPNPDWQDILRAAHQEPLDPAHYAAVRARVLAEIERTRNPWRRLAWISGVAATAAALLLALLSAHRPQLPPLPAPAAPSFTADLAVPAPRPTRVIARAQVQRPRREPLTIKLQTSDPNIVIYWIAD
jgi:hypothetical protein